jgi:hypothetical protein
MYNTYLLFCEMPIPNINCSILTNKLLSLFLILVAVDFLILSLTIPIILKYHYVNIILCVLFCYQGYFKHDLHLGICTKLLNRQIAKQCDQKLRVTNIWKLEEVHVFMKLKVHQYAQC